MVNFRPHGMLLDVAPPIDSRSCHVDVCPLSARYACGKVEILTLCNAWNLRLVLIPRPAGVPRSRPFNRSKLS